MMFNHGLADQVGQVTAEHVQKPEEATIPLPPYSAPRWVQLHATPRMKAELTSLGEAAHWSAAWLSSNPFHSTSYIFHFGKSSAVSIKLNFTTDSDEEQQKKWFGSLAVKQFTFYSVSTTEKSGPGFEQKQLYWFGMKRHLKLLWHSSTKGEGQSFWDLKMFPSFLSIAICERELRGPLMLMITEELSLLRFP